jgi:hypothetical protein
MKKRMTKEERAFASGYKDGLFRLGTGTNDPYKVRKQIKKKEEDLAKECGWRTPIFEAMDRGNLARWYDILSALEAIDPNGSIPKGETKREQMFWVKYGDAFRKFFETADQEWVDYYVPKLNQSKDGWDPFSTEKEEILLNRATAALKELIPNPKDLLLFRAAWGWAGMNKDVRLNGTPDENYQRMGRLLARSWHQVAPKKSSE